MVQFTFVQKCRDRLGSRRRIAHRITQHERMAPYQAIRNAPAGSVVRIRQVTFIRQKCEIKQWCRTPFGQPQPRTHTFECQGLFFEPIICHDKK